MPVGRDSGICGDVGGDTVPAGKIRTQNGRVFCRMHYNREICFRGCVANLTQGHEYSAILPAILILVRLLQISM